MWLSGEHKEDYLLVQEYSFDMPPGLGDFREQQAHPDELARHRRLLDARSVFAAVSAEVSGESFELSRDIAAHLTALTSGNKPLFKLCQASGYAESTVDWLRRYGALTKPCMARALAVTLNGLESLAARFTGGGQKEPRQVLMEQLGTAYRQAVKVKDGDDAELTNSVRSVFKGMLNKLPKSLKDNVRGLERMPEPGQDYNFEFEETIPEFANPMQRFRLDLAIGMVDDSDKLRAYLGAPAPQAIGQVMKELAGVQPDITLRDMHAAAIVAGLRRGARGRLNFLALEGNPGIGKTTAVRQHLEQKSSGYLFLYVSPRVVINRDVTESLAKKDGRPSGILTITSNARLIASAERWHIAQVQAGKDTRRHIDGAVVVDGVSGLQTPRGSILVIDPAQEAEIERIHAGSRMAKMTLSENEDLVRERSLVGVLAGMAMTTRDLMALNPKVNRVVLTAALQGYRSKGGDKTTMQALSRIFSNKATAFAGVAERCQFASRMPEVVVMVDELAGDGAGAPFVHGVARWLQEEFIDCFEDAGERCPFIVTLVISDASLGNEVVLDRYLNAAGPGERAPDKILVSRSAGKAAFRVAATDVRIGGRPFGVLHVMTNSFPASSLGIPLPDPHDARVRPSKNPDGTMQSARQAVRKQAGEALQASALSEIVRALAEGAQQVIYFAQDKNFLSDLQKALARPREIGLDLRNVEIIDSSVRLGSANGQPPRRVGQGSSLPHDLLGGAWRLLPEDGRHHRRGAAFQRRGLPDGDCAAHLPRARDDKNEGWRCDGDDAASLVMLVDDYVVSEDGLDRRQWLRQSTDLMTLLVMLRSTIHTRITGDASALRSARLRSSGRCPARLEARRLMSQSVVNFINEAEVFCRRERDNVLSGLVQERPVQRS